MLTFSLMAVSLLVTGLILVTLYLKKRDKSYLVPGFVLLAAGIG